MSSDMLVLAVAVVHVFWLSQPTSAGAGDANDVTDIVNRHNFFKGMREYFVT